MMQSRCRPSGRAVVCMTRSTSPRESAGTAGGCSGRSTATMDCRCDRQSWRRSRHLPASPYAADPGWPAPHSFIRLWGAHLSFQAKPRASHQLPGWKLRLKPPSCHLRTGRSRRGDLRDADSPIRDVELILLLYCRVHCSFRRCPELWARMTRLRLTFTTQWSQLTPLARLC